MFSHLDAQNRPAMVNVGDKAVTRRTAVAVAVMSLPAELAALLRDGEIVGKKGPIFQTAVLAGVMGAKKTSDLIPLCHPLPITHCEVSFAIPATRDRVVITASAKIAAQTGVEMEALTAVTVAALTIYDMCKAVDKQMVIRDVRLVKKTKRG